MDLWLILSLMNLIIRMDWYPAVAIKATGTVVVEFEVSTIFTDTGETSIEDQAAVHMARKLQLGPNDTFMVKDIRCFVIRQERRLQ